MHLQRIPVILALVVTVSFACIEYRDCFTCIKQAKKIRFNILPCMWCPLSNSCFTRHSVFSHCPESLSASTNAQCEANFEPSMKYDSQLAAKLATWSSLTYVDPNIHDKASIQSAVWSQFNGTYQIIEFLNIDCGWYVEEDRVCGVLVARSKPDNKIVVAFENTYSHVAESTKYANATLNITKLDQSNSWVMPYFKKIHEGLYPCVMSLVKELLDVMPTAEVLVTGHSFGGAQAQLTGINLIRNKVVDKNKLHIYTFGSPRVGNRVFAYEYDRAIINSWRVVIKGDFIPYLIPATEPPFSFHTRREVYYSQPGNMDSSTYYRICMSNELTPGCSRFKIGDSPNTNQYFFADITKYMKAKMFSGETPNGKKREGCRTFPIDNIKGSSKACNGHKSCGECTRASHQSTSGVLKCWWCPLTHTCLSEDTTFGSDCENQHNVKSPSQCAAVADPPMKYDSKLAEELARWSSLAYVDPGSYDNSSIQSTVTTQFGGRYEVAEFLEASCEWFNDYKNCDAVVAKSQTENKIVVAFEGSPTEEVVRRQSQAGLIVMTDFEATGGQIFDFSMQKHETLYPCVKSLVEELIALQPTAEVMVTGHSLGGAQAQLAAAHLVKDEVVSSDKLHVYTFGSPRVGNKDFAYGYDRLMGNSWRVTREHDPAPLAVPKYSNLFGYHTRREVFYEDVDVMNSTTDYNICMSNEDGEGCTEKAGLCSDSSCFELHHNRYFMSNLPLHMRGLLQEGKTPASKKRMTCTSYIV